jgi:hypothetical protein
MIDKGMSLEEMLREASRMAEQTFDARGGISMFWLIDTPAGMIDVISPAPFGGEAKDALWEKMREVMHRRNATRYVQVSESWTAEGPLSASMLTEDEEVTQFVTNVPGSPIQANGYRVRGGMLFVYGVAKMKPGSPNNGIDDCTKHGIDIVTGAEAEDLLRRVQANAEWRESGSTTLADHPLRKELIVFNADDGRERLLATRDIVRPASGKRYLAPIEEIIRPDSIEGRMATELLPSAASAMQH